MRSSYRDSRHCPLDCQYALAIELVVTVLPRHQGHQYCRIVVVTLVEVASWSAPQSDIGRLTSLRSLMLTSFATAGGRTEVSWDAGWPISVIDVDVGVDDAGRWPWIVICTLDLSKDRQ